MTIHIGAKKEDIADTVLMPGDPYRARWAAETYLDNAELVNSVRGMLGFTGTWRGHRLTIQGSGMGMASMAIYANELIKEYGVKQLIRVGSCGGMQKHVELRDIILAMTASSVNTPSRETFRELNFAPTANYQLLRKAETACDELGIVPLVGGIYSSDVFYSERSDLKEQLVRHGVLAVEMETAELYTLAARYGRKALAILTVSDHLDTSNELTSEERENSLGSMFEIALSAAIT